MAHWTKTLHTNFQVDRTNACIVIAVFIFFQSYSATKWQSCALFLFDQRLSSYTCVPSLVKISHFVHGVISFFVKLALPFERFGAFEISLFFLIIIDINCPENISAAVWF